MCFIVNKDHKPNNSEYRYLLVRTAGKEGIFKPAFQPDIDGSPNKFELNTKYESLLGGPIHMTVTGYYKEMDEIRVDSGHLKAEEMRSVDESRIQYWGFHVCPDIKEIKKLVRNYYQDPMTRFWMRKSINKPTFTILKCKVDGYINGGVGLEDYYNHNIIEEAWKSITPIENIWIEEWSRDR